MTTLSIIVFNVALLDTGRQMCFEGMMPDIFGIIS